MRRTGVASEEGRATDARGRPRIPVGIAEYAISADDAVLATSGLGSCVGVALFDHDAAVAGLVHVMLPAADGDAASEAKYADTGVRALVDRMDRAGADRDRLRAKVAGGSDMLDFDSVEDHVGSQNVEAVRTTLGRLEVPIVATDVGGEHGRALEVAPDTGMVTVTTAASGERIL